MEHFGKEVLYKYLWVTEVVITGNKDFLCINKNKKEHTSKIPCMKLTRAIQFYYYLSNFAFLSP